MADSDDARERLYALDGDGLHEINAWLQGYDSFWHKRLDILKRLAEDSDEP